ncbi:hypothetical protein AVEN_176083-1 [Araneus ventricosus]|uniref:Uncharacterized protein n=1 Tax=Araneus ventricosus TaxID=182803 RepID=A0A4Y2LRC4_ARAVE|nr:hypothetical protein AVEN_143966-1 [Araneus ventricosus]GBN16116.1 hypothetical protein AVEN_176083-1 [Araneus ventricosus]
MKISTPHHFHPTPPLYLDIPFKNSAELSPSLQHIVKNMESSFPAMLVLWWGREFYRGKYGMTGSSQAWTPDLGDKFGDFGDEMWDLKGAGIFSISLLGEEIRLNVLDNSM